MEARKIVAALSDHPRFVAQQVHKDPLQTKILGSGFTIAMWDEATDIFLAGVSASVDEFIKWFAGNSPAGISLSYEEDILIVTMDAATLRFRPSSQGLESLEIWFAGPDGSTDCIVL